MPTHMLLDPTRLSIQLNVEEREAVRKLEVKVGVEPVVMRVGQGDVDFGCVVARELMDIMGNNNKGEEKNEELEEEVKEKEEEVKCFKCGDDDEGGQEKRDGREGGKEKRIKWEVDVEVEGVTVSVDEDEEGEGMR